MNLIGPSYKLWQKLTTLKSEVEFSKCHLPVKSFKTEFALTLSKKAKFCENFHFYADLISF